MSEKRNGRGGLMVDEMGGFEREHSVKHGDYIDAERLARWYEANGIEPPKSKEIDAARAKGGRQVNMFANDALW